MPVRVFVRNLLSVAAVIACSTSSLAQGPNPFASLTLGVESKCPFACDSFDLVFAGEYTSSNWQTPFVQRVEPSPSGASLIVYMNISYDSGVGLPVLTPFEKRIPYGPLPSGLYQIVYSIGFLGEPTPIPNRVIRDTIVVGAPGDINCDRLTDIADVVTAINQTFRGAPAPDPPARGDLTCDSHRDILDVLQSIDYVLRAGSVCGPCQLKTPPLIITDIPPESLAVDSFAVWDARIEGDSLRVQYAYGDRCLTHHFAIFMTPSSFEGGVPRIAHIYPVYHDHDDNCEALVVEWISTGLQGLRSAYHDQHPGDPGSIVLRVHHYNSPVYVDLIYGID